MDDRLMNNKEFSELTGIPASTLRKWLVKGKLNGVKRGGQWLIPKTQLHRDNVLARTNAPAPAPDPEPDPEEVKKKAAAKARVQMQTCSIPEFSALTYLTEKGVELWLKNGRLEGSRDEEGGWRVDLANLEAPKFKRFVRGS